VKLLAWLLVLELVWGCAHGGGIIPAPAHAGDPNAKLVRDLVPYASETAWQRSPYWRPMDFGWPWYIIIATDNTACVLGSNVVFLPMVHDYYACRTSWRMARP
jgi:hypothetical protein